MASPKSRNWKTLRISRWIVIATMALVSPWVVAGELAIRVSPRAAPQIAAFYEARGFPVPAVKLISGHCFIGVTLKNDTDKVVWLEPGRWRIIETDNPATESQPLDRHYWQQRWREIGLAASKQATFRWTQLPESRDLQPQEPVGGNIAIPATARPFALELRFATGRERSGPEIRRRFDGLRCR